MALELKVDTIIYCCPDDGDAGENGSIATAKRYIEGNGLTNKDVKITRKHGVIFVKTIREMIL